MNIKANNRTLAGLAAFGRKRPSAKGKSEASKLVFFFFFFFVFGCDSVLDHISLVATSLAVFGNGNWYWYWYWYRINDNNERSSVDGVESSDRCAS